MSNTLKQDAGGILYEGVRDTVGAQFTAKQAYGAVTTDADGIKSQALAVGFPDAFLTGTVTNDNDVVALALSGGQATALVQVTGTFVGTLNFEGAADGGTTWVALQAVQVGANTIGTSTTTPGDWRVNVAGLTNFRVRLHPPTSGTATIRINLSVGVQTVTIANAAPLGPQTSAQSSSVVIASDQTVPVKSGFLEVAGQGTGVVTGVGTDLFPSTDVSAYKWLSIHLAGTYNATLQFQASNDNVNWTPVTLLLLSAPIASNVTANGTSSNGIYAGPIQFRFFRMRVTAFTSNTSLVGTMELYTQSPAAYLSTVNATLLPGTSGGTSDFHLISAATTNATNVKNSLGQVYGYDIGNNGAADAYVKLYNTSSAPTAGSGTPIRTIYVPKGSRVSYTSTTGIAFGTGIGLTITGAAADADTTAVALNQVTVALEYK